MVTMFADRTFHASSDFCFWPIATNFSLGPDVSFRGEAEVGGRQSSLYGSGNNWEQRFIINEKSMELPFVLYMELYGLAQI